MTGHEQIVEARKNRRKPKAIFFEFGIPVEDGFEKREVTRAEEAIGVGLHPVVWIDDHEKPDLRFAIGCQTHVHGSVWSQELIALGHALADAGASTVIVNAIEESPDLMIFEHGAWRTA